MSFIPRDYQNFADESLWRFIHNNPQQNPLVIMPTGTGKSLNMAMFIWRMLATYPYLRIMSVTHVKELIEGNYETLMRLWPAAPAGIYSAGLKRRDLNAQVTFAGIQSVAGKAGQLGKVDFVIIDEAHLVGDRDNSSYIKFLKQLRHSNPNLVVIGFTATAFRMSSGPLTDGKIFDYVAFDGSDGEAFVWFIDNGYLIKPVPKDPGFQLDSSQVSIQAGDFVSGQASAALRDQDILERAVDLTVALGEEQGRQAWLTFCQSIDDAELVADMFRYKGFDVEAVHSKRSDRDEVLKDFRRGKLRGVTNQEILTTGFDYPNIDLIAMLRLTRSPGLWVQMLGRGTRPVYAPGFDLTTREGRLDSILASPKQSCLVLDFVGNTERLGPINYPVIPKRRGKGGGEPPVRICPECRTYHHPSVKVCDECGYVFPPPERLKLDASSADLVKINGSIDLMNLPKPEPREEEVFGVHRMVAAHHKGRKGKPDTMRVDYFCGFKRYSAWICFGHPPGSFPRRKAEEWWKSHGGQGPAPDSVDKALELVASLNKPKFIKVWTNAKYPEILAYDFRGTRFQLPPELGGPALSDPGPDPLAETEASLEERRRALANLAKEMFDDDIPF